MKLLEYIKTKEHRSAQQKRGWKIRDIEDEKHGKQYLGRKISTR